LKHASRATIFEKSRKLALETHVPAEIPGATNRGADGFDHRSEAQLEGLIASAKAGSKSALGRALNACRPRLLQAAGRAISPALRSVLGASDLVQDTFLNAARAIRVFRGGKAREFLNWLLAILFNRLAEITRETRSHQCDGVQIPLNRASDASGHWIHAAATSPSRVLEEEEFGAMIQQASLRLPEREQQALTLRFGEGLSFPEIGRRLGMSEFMARSLFYRALRQMGRELESINSKVDRTKS
jgi:RNA polymerase sigma-70 factor, ECF subfamily